MKRKSTPDLKDALAASISRTAGVIDDPFSEATQGAPEITRVIYVRVAKDVRIAVSQLALDLDTNAQQLMIEAIDDIFLKYDRPPIAVFGSRGARRGS